MTALAPRFGPTGDAQIFAGERIAVEWATTDGGDATIDLAGRVFKLVVWKASDRAEPPHDTYGNDNMAFGAEPGRVFRYTENPVLGGNEFDFAFNPANQLSFRRSETDMLSFLFSTSTRQFGRSAVVTDPGVQAHRLWVGIGDNARQIDVNDAAPTSGNYARGDIVFNRAPAASGWIGWTCVTAGTPGTWKRFGQIDA